MYAITLDESRLPADQRWPVSQKRWWGNQGARPQVFGFGWGPISRRNKYSNRRDAEKEARAHGGLVVDLSTGRVAEPSRRAHGRPNRIEGRGIDDDAGPRGTGPRRSMSFGVMPPRAEFRRHFDYYVGEGGRYRIGNDPIVGYADYSEPELHAFVKKFGSAYSNQREGSKAYKIDQLNDIAKK